MSSILIQKLMKAKAEGTGLAISAGEVNGMMRFLTDDDFSNRKNFVLKAASAGIADAWSAVLFDYNNEYELWIVVCVFSWLTVHALAKRYAARVGGPLLGRPTFIANNIHCITTSLCAAFLLLQDRESRDYNLWMRWALPFSISYFIADGLWYCIPKRDLLISAHHITMILCHYPVGEPVGAQLCGAGSWKWAAWGIAAARTLRSQPPLPAAAPCPRTLPPLPAPARALARSSAGRASHPSDSPAPHRTSRVVSLVTLRSTPALC